MGIDAVVCVQVYVCVNSHVSRNNFFFFVVNRFVLQFMAMRFSFTVLNRVRNCTALSAIPSLHTYPAKGSPLVFVILLS